ncbi:DUF6118 family protein [Rhizobium sp. PL01]|uniref:DUF6118 family protein n=1 Tax=Rhizobium sp. PL01 TaxID=3085631 RepID=UPI00298229A2|nr:DUF6118 family protein [Rhizobium sp. PL01]MDW5318411.1 DUF6118 family protein [Rhizobium sp. PL01]
MTDDDTGPFERGGIDSQEHAPGDPAQAFEALRRTVEDISDDLVREMTTIRKGVEAALDAQEKVQQPIDYGEDLAQLAQNQVVIAQHLEALGKSPILKNGPAHYARALEHSGESLVKTAAHQLQNESRDFQQLARELAGQMTSARERRTQNQWLLVIGLVGGAAGILATLFLPSLLPFSAAPRVASFVMAKSPWRAGMDLMAFDSPESWSRVVSADQLIEANKAQVATCLKAATEASKDYKCTITVPAPVR